MEVQPIQKVVTHIFVDGQNLLHDAQKYFGSTAADYEIKKLSDTICGMKGWEVGKIFFYTGIPTVKQNEALNYFWANKIRAMKRENIDVTTRKTVDRYKIIKLYRNVTVRIYDVRADELGGHENDKPWATLKGKEITENSTVCFYDFEEKGIDVAITVEMMKSVLSKSCNAIVIFSRDNDFAPAVQELKSIAKMQGRTLSIASAFPYVEGLYGIDGTEHIRYDKAVYQSCIDANTNKYFPKQIKSR